MSQGEWDPSENDARTRGDGLQQAPTQPPRKEGLGLKHHNPLAVHPEPLGRDQRQPGNAHRPPKGIAEGWVLTGEEQPG